MGTLPIRSVAVIGAGAAGAAAAAALKAEDYFEVVKVFERREAAGGTWIYDPDPDPVPLRPGHLPPTIDAPLKVPDALPRTTPPDPRYRYLTTPIYEGLTTNVPDIAMAFVDRPFPYGPFVPHYIPKQYIESYFSHHNMDSTLALNTTVEDVQRINGDKWKLVLRRSDIEGNVDYWWEEEFDALVLANGHYSVPYIPAVKGLSDFIAAYPGRVEHSKTYRTPRLYANKRVLVIGNSASGYDVAMQLLESKLPSSPVYVSRRSRSRWDGDKPPVGAVWKPVISEYRLDGSIVFADGTSLRDIDTIIYCTGYKPSYPFWNIKSNGRPLYDYDTDCLVDNYQHTFMYDYPTLGFIGFPRVLTFRSFEYQAIALARLWSGRATHLLPPVSEQRAWFGRRASLVRREGRKFHQIEWDHGETMEWFRYLFELAGLPILEGFGRCPPVLGPQTSWAIDHIKKYPEYGKGVRLEEADDGWEIVQERDSLHFI